MKDLKKWNVVALAFATVHSFDYLKCDIRKGTEIRCKRDLQNDAIIEVAAVKIQGGEIRGHFHSFVAIDEYEPKNIEFDDFNMFCYRATPNLLIGAPSIKDVMEQLKDYIGDSAVICFGGGKKGSGFELFKEIARNNGCVFDNAAVYPSDLYTMIKLKRELTENANKFEDMSVLQLAHTVNEKPEQWTDIFAEFNIYFNPEECKPYEHLGRDDPLSWALAFAQLYINIQEEEEALRDDFKVVLKPVDEDLPF